MIRVGADGGRSWSAHLRGSVSLATCDNIHEALLLAPVRADLLAIAQREVEGPRERHCWLAPVFPPRRFAAMMSDYVQSPLGNSEHGEHRRKQSHIGHAEGRVE